MNDPDFIFGLRPVIEAIRAGKQIDRLLVRKGLRGDLYHELLKEVRDAGIHYHAVPAERLDHVTRKNHQGVIAWLSAIEFQNIENILPSVFEAGGSRNRARCARRSWTGPSRTTSASRPWYRWVPRPTSTSARCSST